MGVSLRLILPLLLVLGAFAYAVVPLVNKLTLQWFVRDIDSRASLIANTIQGPLQDLARAGNRTRLLEYFTRITQDERFSGSSEHLLKSPAGALLVSVRPLAVGGAPAGQLVLVHDMSFIARRSAETRKYLFYFFVGLGVTVSLITVVVAQLSWRGWVQGLRAVLRGEGLFRPADAPEAPELRPIAADLRALIRDLEAEQRSRDEDQLAWTPETLRGMLRADLLGHVDCTRRRLRRPRGGGRARTGGGATGAAGLPAPPRLADARGGGGLLLRLCERRPVAAVPYRPRASDLPHLRLGAIHDGEPNVRPRRGRGGEVARPDRAGPGLPLCVVAEDDPGVAADCDDRFLLAHSLAKPGSVRELPLAGRAARRTVGLEHSRVPHPVSLQQFRRYRRSPGGSAGGPRDVHRLVPGQADRRQALSHLDRVAAATRPGRQADRGVPGRGAAAVRPAGRPQDRRRRGSAGLHEGHRRAVPRGGAPAGAGAGVAREIHLHPDRRTHAHPHRSLPGIRSPRARDGGAHQRALRRRGSSADRAPRGASSAEGHLRVLSRRGAVHGHQPARRHEPRGQGVRVLARRRARRADPER